VLLIFFLFAVDSLCVYLMVEEKGNGGGGEDCILYA
jgi:hypothetical protein